MNTQCLNGIMGTGGVKTATLREKLRKSFLVDPDQKYQDPCWDGTVLPGISGFRTPAEQRCSVSSFMTSGRVAFFILRRGISTARQGRIRLLSRRKLSHINRRARFRSTASRLNFRLHITPNLANFPSPGATETAINSPARRKGALFRRSNSDLRCSLEPLRRCKRWSAKIRSLKLIWR